MSHLRLSSFLCAAFIIPIVTSSPAFPAVQHLNPRDQYQGGWPLALTGTNSGSCPTDASVQCASTEVNPECCPSGQTCVWGGFTSMNYCCPTSADCNTAVINFPRCANSTWNMFINSPSGFFCCDPGTLGVIPSAGTPGGLCEPSDQFVPKSLLATMVSQVGVATPTPTASVVPSNATTTAGGPAETNPSLLPSSTSDAASGSESSGSGLNGIQNWSKPVKIGVGVGLGAAFVTFIVLGTLCNRRRRNNNLTYEYRGYSEGINGYDEYGNALPIYGHAHKPYGRDIPNENNVTVNVVQGDLQHS